jgi:hypothetical protein
LVGDALEDALSDALEVRVEFGELDIELLEGMIAVHDASMRVPDAAEDLMRVSGIAIDADWGALLRGELHAERIAIDHPEIFFEIDSMGRLNWSALGGEDTPDKPPDDNQPKATFRVSAAEFDVVGGTITLVDHREGGLPDVHTTVGDLSIQDAEIERESPAAPVGWALSHAAANAWHVSAVPPGGELYEFAIDAVAGPIDEAGSLPVKLDLERTKGVTLTAKGAIRRRPFGFDLAMRWDGLSSRRVAPLVLRGAVVERGRANGDVRLALELGDADERGLAVTGNVTHDDLLLRVENDPPIELDIERFSGEIERIWFPMPKRKTGMLSPVEVSWKRVELKSPSIEIMPARSTPRAADDSSAEPAAGSVTDAAGTTSDSTRAAAESSAPARPTESAPGSSSADLALSIAALSFSDGRLAWHDTSLGEHARQELSQIAFDASGFQWPPATVEHLKLVVESVGAKPLTVEGQVRDDGADLEIGGRRIEISPWNPIIRAHSDYSATSGSLSLESTYQLRGQTFQGSAQVTLHRVRASTDGSGFVRTFGIPLSAAISLLSDPSGDIQLNLPVNGEIGTGRGVQVGVSLVDAMREGIMNALTTVIVSPLSIAGSIASKGIQMTSLRIGEGHFAPGEETLDQAAMDELDRAAAFVAKSPDARLGLVAEIVSADLEVLGSGEKRPNVFRRIFYGGMALVGGGRTLDSRTYTLALELARARLDASKRHITSSGLLSAERVVRDEWSGAVSEGTPRIGLRLAGSEDAADQH